MKAIPLLIRRHELVRAHSGITRDQVSLDDEVPAVLNRDASGYVLSRDTRITEVKQETVDDR